jgi:hypothetical protein
MKDYLNNKIKSLNMDQLDLFNEMQKNNLLQVCIPTGAGKGYLMMVDLLNQVISKEFKIFVISSHRLMLNTQHLNDIFDIMSPMIGDIGYVFVGSSKYDISKFQENIEFNTKLLKNGISYNEIISSTNRKSEIEEIVKNHHNSGRKVIILTTYHSLHTLNGLEIDTIYNDEAHTLASELETAQFRENFNSINYNRCFFFTATPKDCVEETETFLMNNENLFGRRIGLNFRQCVENGYIVKPVIHIAMPEEYDNSYDFKSINNMSKFIMDTYEAHSKFIKENSVDSNKIEAKILVKCPSVDDMWLLHKELIGKIDGVKICAGASRNELSTFFHFIDDEGIVSRSKYLERIQNFENNDKVIVLHYDTMSEGINVAGFTGVEFLGGKLPTITKTLQNTGRSTRLHKEDRDKFGRGEIIVGDGNWIKPYCGVIIPYWDKESEFTTRELARQIRELRDNFSYDPIFYVSIGSDIGEGKKVDDIDSLNKIELKSKKIILIENILNEIEVMDKEYNSNLELERLKKMEFDEWFNFINENGR